MKLLIKYFPNYKVKTIHRTSNAESGSKQPQMGKKTLQEALHGKGNVSYRTKQTQSIPKRKNRKPPVREKCIPRQENNRDGLVETASSSRVLWSSRKQMAANSHSNDSGEGESSVDFEGSSTSSQDYDYED